MRTRQVPGQRYKTTSKTRTKTSFKMESYIWTAGRRTAHRVPSSLWRDESSKRVVFLTLFQLLLAAPLAVWGAAGVVSVHTYIRSVHSQLSCACRHVCTYIHAYMPTCIHQHITGLTYIHAYMPTCIRPCVRTNIHTCLHCSYTCVLPGLENEPKVASEGSF